jgi:nucleoside-diphosphate-sugar epimerase
MLLIDHMIPHDGLDSHPDSDSGRPARSRPPSRPRTPVAGDPSYFGHGTSGYYFAESDEHEWLSVAEAIGRAMVDLGRATEPTPTPFTDEEKEQFFNNQTKYLDSNSRCSADRAKRLGWKPKKTTKDLLASIKIEVKGGNIV